MRVVGLFRYPVKSMQGEELDAATVDELGITGDRQWAVVDTATGLALTGRREPALLFARAHVDGADDVSIELPDGSVATSDDDLSAWLGHPVELRRAAPSSHGRFEIATDFEAEDTSEWVTTRPQPDGIARDLDVLRTINRERDGFLGVGALVIGGGTVAIGDELSVE